MRSREIGVMLAMLVVLAATSTLRAGPPFVTDDPEPVELHHWEVYVFSVYNHTAGNDGAQIPAVEVNYGAVENLQLHLVAPMTLSRGDGEAAHYGYGDTERV